MKLKIIIISFLFLSCILISAQNKIEFVEYNLDNGLHVILSPNTTTPIVAITVTYHVGSKNEKPEENTINMFKMPGGGIMHQLLLIRQSIMKFFHQTRPH
jgi:hypothetical protein